MKMIRKMPVTSVEDGWIFNLSDKDFQAQLRCKICGHVAKVIDCPQSGLCACGNECCGSPIFYVLCPKCFQALGILDERDSKQNPRFNLQPDGEFVNPPDS
jgi:hypothetical protein